MKRQISTRMLFLIVTILLFLCGYIEWQLRNQQPPREKVSFNCSSSTLCFFNQMCINDDIGIFVVSEEPIQVPSTVLPGVNFPRWDYELTPKVVHPRELFRKWIYHHPDTVLLVVGSFSPFHLSHFLINYVAPIQHILHTYVRPGEKMALLSMGRFLGEGFAWYPIDFFNFTRQFHSGALDYKLDKYESYPIRLTNHFRILTSETHCYSKVIVGVEQACSTCAFKPSAEAYADLRKKVLGYYRIDEEPIPGSVLLVQRRGRREIINFDGAISIVEQFTKNFQTAYLEEHPFPEQVRLYARASIVIAPHGNANGHIHWMKPGAVFIEAFNPSKFGLGFYEVIALHLGLHYHPLFCNTPGCEPLKSDDDRSQKMEVNLDELKQILQKHFP